MIFDPTAAPEPIDLAHLGRAHVIAAWLVGEVIVDPGPTSCLAKLLESLGGRRPRALALTHVHLDHAGAAGSLCELFPNLEVWVHERGAAHLIDPSKLVRSAARLYGEDMQRMWGEVLPVPGERVRTLQGGETLGELRVAYTPGHATHHVCYLHTPTGVAFTGDVAGVRIDGAPVLPPTPPPDIDLVAWQASLDVLEGWRPSALALTHFGAYDDVEEHISALRAALARVRDLARDLDEDAFVSAIRATVGQDAHEQTAAAYEQALPPWQSYRGLVRAAERAQSSRVCEHPPRGDPTA